LLYQLGMRQLVTLLLVSGLLVPVFSTEALCAKSHATAAHPKKASHHKKHPQHASAKPASAPAPSGEKTTPTPATAE